MFEYNKKNSGVLYLVIESVFLSSGKLYNLLHLFKPTDLNFERECWLQASLARRLGVWKR